ncbi:MAG: LysR family transcriptional regulator [Verrucomicrobiota bacterium]
MKEISPTPQASYQGLPNITLRQLEVFRLVCREESYANAALELHSTRANIKRVCDDFEKAVGRPLFEEGNGRELKPTAFADGLISQISPLSRSLRALGDTVRNLHQQGRVLRFAAAGELFRGGLFTDFLTRLQISDSFRPCFLRIEAKRCRTALLNAECDVYFGAGITDSDRLDQVHLGDIPWRFETGDQFRATLPKSPLELPQDRWWIAEAGEPESSAVILDRFHAAGAMGGRVLSAVSTDLPGPHDIVLYHDTTARQQADSSLPCYRFSALLRKHHPYSELLPRLKGAAS